jgi:hypothetical protein
MVMILTTLIFRFAERSGTNALVKEAIIKLISNRPSDPVSFLVDL